MSLDLMPLPYSDSALEPHISARTLSFHYGKHHAGYVKKLNAQIEDTDYATLDLTAIIQKSHLESNTAVFNNAAQIWNHDQFWLSMGPEPSAPPSGKLGAAIERDFGSFDALVGELKSRAAGVFGSGWVWLVVDDGQLRIAATQNAHTPMTSGATALLTIDVWEHAYYLDYQNDRPAYIDVFFDQLVNWQHAETVFEGIAD